MEIFTWIWWTFYFNKNIFYRSYNSNKNVLFKGSTQIVDETVHNLINLYNNFVISICSTFTGHYDNLLLTCQVERAIMWF